MVLPTTSTWSIRSCGAIGSRQRSFSSPKVWRGNGCRGPNESCTCFSALNERRWRSVCRSRECSPCAARGRSSRRSEEHTSELQSRRDLVCRLLLEKKKKYNKSKLHNRKKKKKQHNN